MKKWQKGLIVVLVLLLMASQGIMISFYKATGIPKDMSEIEKITVKSRTTWGGEYLEILNIQKEEDIEEFMSMINKGRYTVDLFIKDQSYSEVEDLYISIYTKDKGYTVYINEKMTMTTKCYDGTANQSFKHYYSYGNGDWYDSLIELKEEVVEEES